MIEPPILIHELDEDSIEVYPSVAEAEGSMEAIDVKAGLYIAYDSHGRKLKIIPDGYVGRLHQCEDTVSFVHELRPRLLKHLGLVVPDVEQLRDAPFRVLLNTVLVTKPKPKTLRESLQDWLLRWFK